ncbi:LysM peptidoglycan-binding domain-containing protein [Viridibacillus arvi]|uniref:LysM peptidoglycan-binding domain-containing protein n=1 Tax=Viridibacillus arvi TaxID=263475 RepID=UPI003D28240A
MYEVFIDGVQFPVAPAKLDTRINNKNQTITLMNDGEVNLLKKPGLTDFSFEVLLPNVKYPFAVYPDGFQPATFYLEKLEKLKLKKKKFQFIVTRSKPNGDLLFDTNIKVSLEEYEIKEDAENGFDINVPIVLKQYQDYGTKTIKLKKPKKKSKTKKKVAVASKKRPSAKTAPKTHKVVKDDTLWAICKKYLGDGSKYPEIAKKNNIKNPHLIYPGQVIKLG